MVVRLPDRLESGLGRTSRIFDRAPFVFMLARSGAGLKKTLTKQISFFQYVFSFEIFALSLFIGFSFSGFRAPRENKHTTFNVFLNVSTKYLQETHRYFKVRRNKRARPPNIIHFLRNNCKKHMVISKFGKSIARGPPIYCIKNLNLCFSLALLISCVLPDFGSQRGESAIIRIAVWGGNPGLGF